MEWNTYLLWGINTINENFWAKWRVTPLYTIGGMHYTHVKYFLYARLVVLLRQIADEITNLGQRVWQWIQVHNSMNTDPKAYISKLSLSTEWRSQWQLSGARGNLVNALRDRKIRWRLPTKWPNIGRRRTLQAAADKSQRRSVNGVVGGRIAPARTEYTIKWYFRKKQFTFYVRNIIILHIIRSSKYSCYTTTLLPFVMYYDIMLCRLIGVTIFLKQ